MAPAGNCTVRVENLPAAFWDAAKKSLDVTQKRVNLLAVCSIKGIVNDAGKKFTREKVSSWRIAVILH
jgi:hypothetical protein